MKRYVCVQVDHHNNIPFALEEYLSKGWVLHSYQAVNISLTSNVKHYLLLEKDDSGSKNPTIEEAVKLSAEKG